MNMPIIRKAMLRMSRMRYLLVVSPVRKCASASVMPIMVTSHENAAAPQIISRIAALSETVCFIASMTSAFVMPLYTSTERMNAYTEATHAASVGLNMPVRCRR